MTDPTRISPQEASAKLAEGWTYVDVRTTQEFEAGQSTSPSCTRVRGAWFPTRNSSP